MQQLMDLLKAGWDIQFQCTKKNDGSEINLRMTKPVTRTMSSTKFKPKDIDLDTALAFGASEIEKEEQKLEEAKKNDEVETPV